MRSLLKSHGVGRRLAGVFALAFLAAALQAQDQTSVALQGKNIEVKYAASAMGGRKIFGATVPYGQVWRIGDKAAPVLRTEGDLAFYGVTVPKGDYTLWALPAADKWQLIISRQTGTGAYNPKMDVGRVPMTLGKTAAPVESCKITLTKTAALSAKLEIAWENTVGSVPIRLDLVGADREW
jgi:hypothetical protein